MNNPKSSPLSQVSRKDIFAFTQWLRTLPWEQTLFLHTTYYSEDVRQQNVKDLYASFLSLRSQNKLPKPRD